DRFGNTPLHMAAKINANRFVLDLLNAGADPNLRNRQGATFQRYMNMTPTTSLTADARQQRETVVAWLRAHNVPVETAGTPG
ncbi:MAG TPA: ankyrin repeat domain-containing protein, partial [Polyangiaceae bacterium]|nr:ankyrin repeat domain-containing protein [Polyangiaceae bacterium]